MVVPPPFVMCGWKVVPDWVLVGHFKCRCQLLCSLCDSEHTFDPSRTAANKGVAAPNEQLEEHV